MARSAGACAEMKEFTISAKLFDVGKKNENV